MPNAKKLPLRNVPPYIHEYLVNMQADIRKKTGHFKGLERIIYDIISEKMRMDKK
jgi:hypothetical protein